MLKKIYAAAAACLALVGGVARAEDYPARPVTIVVPGGVGGAVDGIARVFGKFLSLQMGQSVIIDDRAGAGGNIGTADVARAPHDGYTLLMAASSAQTINPSLYSKIPFDPQKDFEPISLVATAPVVLVVNPGLVPVKNVGEFIALAKSKAVPLNYGSAGVGSLNHLTAEMFKTRAGIQMTHVPYKSVAAAASDTASGQVQVLFGSLTGVMPLIHSGQLHALAVATSKRTALAPDLPTIAETLPGFEVNSWYGLMAPAGTPPEVLNRLRAMTLKALASKELADALSAQGAEVLSDTPDQFRTLIAQDITHWAKVVKASGAKND